MAALHISLHRPVRLLRYAIVNRRAYAPVPGRSYTDGRPYASETLFDVGTGEDALGTVITEAEGGLTVALLSADEAVYVAAARDAPEAGNNPRILIPPDGVRLVCLPGGYRFAAREVGAWGA